MEGLKGPTMLTLRAEVITEDITHGRAALCFADRDTRTSWRAKLPGVRGQPAAGQYDSDGLPHVVRERSLEGLRA
jgi:hypothetical protein